MIYQLLATRLGPKTAWALSVLWYSLVILCLIYVWMLGDGVPRAEFRYGEI